MSGPDPRACARLIAAAAAAFALFAWLGLARQVEPFHTYFYLFAWAPFLVALGAVARVRAGYRLTFRRAVDLGIFSTTFWLVFECLNVRLHDWSYLGVPASLPLRWTGYALSFATVVPGLLLAAHAIAGRRADAPAAAGGGHAAFGEVGSGFRGPRAQGRGPIQALAGTALLALPMIWPTIFFPLVWLAFILLLDPIVEWRGAHSLIDDWRAGRFRWTVGLLLGGLICGLFWEACNYAAGGKWVYHLPALGFLKVFEMPILGFLGFPPFALEAYAAWEAVGERMPRWLLAAVPVFWAVAFALIDRYTVAGFV